MDPKDTIIPDKISFKDDMYAYINIERPVGTDRLPCYDTVFDERTKEVSCWVASEEYRNFTILFRNKAYPSCSIRVALYLDGQEIQHRYFRAYKDQYFKFSAQQISLHHERPFMFAPLDVTDDELGPDSFIASAANWKQVGKISLEIHRVTDVLPKSGTKPTKTALTDDYKKYRDIPEIHQFSRKYFLVDTMPHQIVYGDIRPVRHKRYPGDIERSGTILKERIVTFTFRYRPIEYIQQNVISCFPTGSSSSAGHEIEDGNQSGTSNSINFSILQGCAVVEDGNEPNVNQAAVEDNERTFERLPTNLGKRKRNAITDNTIKRVRALSPPMTFRNIPAFFEN